MKKIMLVDSQAMPELHKEEQRPAGRLLTGVTPLRAGCLDDDWLQHLFPDFLDD